MPYDEVWIRRANLSWEERLMLFSAAWVDGEGEAYLREFLESEREDDAEFLAAAAIVSDLGS